jgi:hypothetical protein
LSAGIIALGDAGVFKTNDVVDYTFALQCTELEGEWDQNILLPWSSAVKDYEKKVEEYDNAVQRLDDRGIAKNLSYDDAAKTFQEWVNTRGEEQSKVEKDFGQGKKDNHIEDYWDMEHGRLIAYNHGLPDPSGNAAMAYSHVVEVTLNVIRIAGGWHSENEGRVEGSFDRITGQGMIK